MTTEHIKMPDVTPIVRYVANGAQTIFSYPFPIFADGDLVVEIDGAPQVSGFTIAGAGETAGGTVTFDNAPANGAIIGLIRDLPLERVTDFLQGGHFSATAINNELDYLIASIQQVNRANELMLKYSDAEEPGNVELPMKTLRANKVLGFDGNGNPTAVSAEGTMASPNFTASGTGAITRTSSDKFSDYISVKDFGAVGDGLVDDTVALQNALAAHDHVFLPAGTYLITSTVSVAANKSLIGNGQKSIIKCQTDLFHAIEIPANNVVLHNFRIEGGLIGIKLFGSSAECSQNSVIDIQIIGAETGILLDGYTDTNKPCYWNNFARILIEQPLTNGIHLTKSGAGDTPNANRFHMCRVYSKGAATTGSGIYVEYGALNNSFIDCECDMNGATATACVKVGANASETFFINLLTEGGSGLDNVVLDSGSTDTVLTNLSAMSDGGAIADSSGGEYHALNAGYPDKNTLRKTTVTDLKANLMRYATLYIDTAGTTVLDLAQSMHIVNATNGAITLELPMADSDNNGAEVTVKKSDSTDNVITLQEEAGGSGIDGGTVQLGGEDDYVTVISNGAEWFVKSFNRMPSHPRYYDGTGTYDIDMSVDIYLLSSYSGAMTARLPPANAAEANGRTVTIKKTDSSANAITVTEQGGNGPDQSSYSLSAQYDAVTCVSNGAQWYILATV